MLKNISENIDCSIVLDFWNTVQDLSHSIDKAFYGNEDRENQEILYVYNQLFYGSNPKAIRGGEEFYYPNWNNENRQIIKNVVKDALRILEKALNIEINIE